MGEQRAEPDALLGVESGGRFVHDEQARVVEQCLRDADAPFQPPEKLFSFFLATVDRATSSSNSGRQRGSITGKGAVQATKIAVIDTAFTPSARKPRQW